MSVLGASTDDDEAGDAFSPVTVPRVDDTIEWL